MITGVYNLIAKPEIWRNVNQEQVFLPCDTSGGPVVINLFKMTDLKGFPNVKIFISDETNNAATNNITINAFAGDKIDSGTTVVLNVNGASTELQVAEYQDGKWLSLESEKGSSSDTSQMCFGNHNQSGNPFLLSAARLWGALCFYTITPTRNPLNFVEGVITGLVAFSGANSLIFNGKSGKFKRAYIRVVENTLDQDLELVLRKNGNNPLRYYTPKKATTFAGSSGSCDVVINGNTYPMVWNTDIDTTVNDFLTVNQATILATEQVALDNIGGGQINFIRTINTAFTLVMNNTIADLTGTIDTEFAGMDNVADTDIKIDILAGQVGDLTNIINEAISNGVSDQFCFLVRLKNYDATVQPTGQILFNSFQVWLNS